MASYTKESFKAEVEGAWARILGENLGPKHKKKIAQATEIEAAWALYTNAKNSNLSDLLLGVGALRTNVEIMRNFGTTSGLETTMERRILVDSGTHINVNDVVETLIGIPSQNNPQSITNHIRLGSVLNDGRWWPFRNDAWVLGGTHGLRNFHIALGAISDDAIWDKSHGRPTMLGRELIGLHAAGYSLIGLPSWAKKTLVPSGDEKKEDRFLPELKPDAAEPIRATLGFVFAPTSKAKAENLTFTTYHVALQLFRSKDSLKERILQAEIPYESYTFGEI